MRQRTTGRRAGALAELIAPPRRPEVVRVEQIPLTPGGKLRTIVSTPGQ